MFGKEIVIPEFIQSRYKQSPVPQKGIYFQIYGVCAVAFHFIGDKPNKHQKIQPECYRLHRDFQFPYDKDSQEHLHPQRQNSAHIFLLT